MLVAQSAIDFCFAARQPGDLFEARSGTSSGFPVSQVQQRLDDPIMVLARVRVPKKGEKNEPLEEAR
jgi:hypothetical protein